MTKPNTPTVDSIRLDVEFDDVIEFDDFDNYQRPWYAYDCRLTLPGTPNSHVVEVKFHQGVGYSIDDMPDKQAVLWSLCADIESLQGITDDSIENFKQWAYELGHDPDSMKAYEIFKGCVKERNELIALLGEDSLADLINEMNELEG